MVELEREREREGGRKRDEGEGGYPLGLTTVLEIFIFLWDPEYNSSRLQDNFVSTGGGFFNCALDPPPLVAPPPALVVPSLYGLNFPSPNPPNVPAPSVWNRIDLARPIDSNPNGLLLLKNSVNTSSAFRGLYR